MVIRDIEKVKGSQIEEEYRVVGPPGCGKTTWLSRQVENAAGKNEVPLIASLTRAAAFEVAGKNLPIPVEMVGTLHAHCYRALDRPEIAEGTRALKAWNEEYPAWLMAGGKDVDDDNLDYVGGSEGDKLKLTMETFRARMIPSELWPNSLAGFTKTWNDWKESCGLLDFTDLIEQNLLYIPHAPGRPTVLFIDEGQDMNLLEMSLIRKWGKEAGYLVVVGDPDQNLYQWRGSDPEAFTKPDIDPARKMVLSQSYRVPEEVHRVALDWINNCPGREEVEYRPRAEKGLVDRVDATWRNVEAAVEDYQRRFPGKSVMFLASCSYMLAPLLHVLRERGIPFHNPYRRKAGGWNPLHKRGTAVTSGERLMAFLQLKENGKWAAEDVKKWTDVLKIKGVLPPHGRDVVNVLYDEDDGGVSYDLLEMALSPEALEAGMEGDLRWLCSNMLAGKAKGIQFPISIYESQGIQGLIDEPLVIPGTIHSVKGGEADVVYLMPDLSQPGLEEWEGSGKASVYRLFYVGMTRAKEALVVLRDSSGWSVDLHDYL